MRCDPHVHRSIILGDDGSPAAEDAIRKAARLLGPRKALVVVVWEAGAPPASSPAPSSRQP